MERLQHKIHRHIPTGDKVQEFTSFEGPDILEDRDLYWLFGKEGIALTPKDSAPAAAQRFHDALQKPEPVEGLVICNLPYSSAAYVPMITLERDLRTNIEFGKCIAVAKMFETNSSRIGAEELSELLRNGDVHVFPAFWAFPHSGRTERLCRMSFGDAIDPKYVVFSRQAPDSSLYRKVEEFSPIADELPRELVQQIGGSNRRATQTAPLKYQVPAQP